MEAEEKSVMMEKYWRKQPDLRVFRSELLNSCGSDRQQLIGTCRFYKRGEFDALSTKKCAAPYAESAHLLKMIYNRYLLCQQSR
jgi:hypothetical protein